MPDSSVKSVHADFLASIDDKSVILWIDGKQVFEKPVQPMKGTPTAGGIAFGSLVDHSIGCAGLIDDASYLKLLQGWGLDSNSAAGAVLKGWVESRFGIVPVILLGAVSLGLGFVACGMAGSITGYAVAQGLLIGFLAAAPPSCR